MTNYTQVSTTYGSISTSIPINMKYFNGNVGCIVTASGLGTTNNTGLAFVEASGDGVNWGSVIDSAWGQAGSYAITLSVPCNFVRLNASNCTLGAYLLTVVQQTS